MPLLSYKVTSAASLSHDIIMSDDLELKDVFAAATKLVDTLKSGELRPLSSEFKETYAECLKLLALSTQKVDQLDLFSSNEEVDDITTSTLKYFNIDYYAALVLESVPVDVRGLGVLSRVASIKVSVRKYLDFLILLDSVGIIKDKKTPLEQIFPNGFGGAFDLEMFKGNRPRDSVVSDFKKMQREKMLFENASNKMDNDEEAARNFELRQLNYHAAIAWDNVRQSTQELNMLGSALSQANDDPKFSKAEILYREDAYPHVPGISYDVLKVLLGRNRAVPPESLAENDGKVTLADVQKKLESSTQVELPNNIPNKLLNKKGQPMKPFRIVPSREEVGRQVFGTGQQMPTMTVEELLAKEMADGRIVQPSSQNYTNGEEHQSLEEEYRKDDEATMKARVWDDFTEANPRGSGNTLNLG